MTIKFDIDKIVKYLDKYKSKLPELYDSPVKIDKLVKLEILTKECVNKLNTLTNYEKELRLKKIVGQRLNDTLKSNSPLFGKLCLWIIKDWGGIYSPNDNDTIKLINVINDFLKQDKPSFYRIASFSKVKSFLFPDKSIIYDSRVAYSLNWIILTENAGQQYFPIPNGRNSKMSAFEMNVLIRLKNISAYQTTKINDTFFIKNSDNKLFINEKDAYFELNNLIMQINKKLWKGDKEKEENLYFTEMLLFSIADKAILEDIITKYGGK